MRRKTLIGLTMIAAVALGVLVVWPSLGYFMLSGHFWPIDQIETLQNPIAVTGWNSDGLRLADGRTLRLPGLRSLPAESPALAETTKRGVEIGADGRIWGLVSIHHWCGNDPVRNHIARVDLSDLMIFLRVGEPIPSPIPAIDWFVKKPGGDFIEELGWNVSEFKSYLQWRSYIEESR